jgi:hypothetical protein
VTRGPRPAPRALAGALAVVVVLLALPLLLAAVTVGTGGLAHEAGLHAATHDTSLAALHRVDRFLHGDLTVTLAPAFEAPAPPPAPPACASGQHVPVRTERAPAGLAAAESERRL